MHNKTNLLNKKTTCILIAVSVGASIVLSGCTKENDADTVALSAVDDTIADSYSDNLSDGLSSDTDSLAAENVTDEKETQSSSDGNDDLYYSFEQKSILDIPVVSGEFKLEDCVDVGDYKDITLDKYIYSTPDSDVDGNLLYQMEPVEVESEDATVQTGDVIIVDIVGMIGDEVVEDITRSDYEMKVGADSFISGFDKHLEGMKKEETREVNMQLPDDFNPEIGGKDAVFTVTVSSVKRVPEMTDDLVREITGGSAETVAEYTEQIRSSLVGKRETESDDSLREAAWGQIVSNSSILAFPEEYINNQRLALEQQLETDAANNQTTKDEYIQMLGMSPSDLEEYYDKTSREFVKNQLIAEYIAELEEIDTDSEEYKEALKKAESAAADNEGQTAEAYAEAKIKQAALQYVVVSKVLETANINIVQSNAEPEASAYAFENSIPDGYDIAEPDYTSASDFSEPESTEPPIDGVLYYNSAMEQG